MLNASSAEIVLYIDGAEYKGCAGTGCTLHYTPSITPTASTHLSTLRAAPGDTILLETGNWLVDGKGRDSNGDNAPGEQHFTYTYPHPAGTYVEGMLGGHPLQLDEHTSTLRRQPHEHAAAAFPAVHAHTSGSTQARTAGSVVDGNHNHAPGHDASNHTTAQQQQHHHQHQQPQQPQRARAAHMMHLMIPTTLSAGSHALEIVLDRDDYNHPESQGKVVFHTYGIDGSMMSSAPYITVLPTIAEVHPPHAAVGEQITIVGSGFSHAAAENSITLSGNRSCTPLRTDTHYIVCSVGGENTAGRYKDPDLPAHARASTTTASTVVAKGIPLQLIPSTKQLLKATAACFAAVYNAGVPEAVACHTAAAVAADSELKQAGRTTPSRKHTDAGSKEAAGLLYRKVEHVTVTNEAGWPSVHPASMHGRITGGAVLATSTSTLRPPRTGLYRFQATCVGQPSSPSPSLSSSSSSPTYTESAAAALCVVILSGGDLSLPVRLNPNNNDGNTTTATANGSGLAELFLQADLGYTVTWVFAHAVHGNQAALLVAFPSTGSAAGTAHVATSHLMPVPAEWFEHDIVQTPDSATHATTPSTSVSLMVHGIPAVCRSASGPSGCQWYLSSILHKDEQEPENRATNNPSNLLSPRIDATSSASSHHRRGRRHVDSQELQQPLPNKVHHDHDNHERRRRRRRNTSVDSVFRWSEEKAAYQPNGLPDPFFIPAGETWILDADIDARGLIVYGTFLWDVEKDNIELRANFILVEGNGKFLVGFKDAPMQFRATIYIKGSKCQWESGTCIAGAGEGASADHIGCAARDASIKDDPSFTTDTLNVTATRVRNGNGLCLKARGGNPYSKVEMGSCTEGEANDVFWTLDSNTGLFKNAHNGCLDFVRKLNNFLLQKTHGHC